MPFTNAGAAAIFDEIADLLEVQGGGPFRVRAYRRAALTLEGLGRSAADMLAAGDRLESLPGIGKDLAGKIAEIVATGTCRMLEELRAQVPAGITQLLRLPGLGPQRVQALHRALGIASLQDLQRAAGQQKVRTVRGFSEAMERHLLEAASVQLAHVRRFTLQRVTGLAEALLDTIRQAPGVREAVVAGSLRRCRETVGDLDLLVAAGSRCPAAERFVAAPGVQRVLAHGPTRSSVILREGIQVDLRVVPPVSFGAAWLYFTGSKAHNIALRTRAQQAGLKLNEYGLFRGTKRIAGRSESSVYEALGLPWIAPELREDRGEIDAALAGRLPRLVQARDLRGDLHMHTTDSDGADSLAAMAEAARRRGLEYIAITDHSARLAMVHGLDAGRLARQIDEIDRLNASLHGIRLLKSIEVDILENGELDLPDRVLARLDLVVAGVHERLGLPREKQTRRLLRAMDHPCFTILAHPTGRLLEQRQGSDVDMEQVVRHARERGCFLELDAQPLRLDLDDVACRLAREAGVLVSIATDAHGAAQLGYAQFGIGQARRGWLEPADVLNTRPLHELLPLLAATMGRSAPALAVA